MDTKKFKRICASALCLALFATSMPTAIVKADSDIVISKDFEDGISGFTARENQSTIELVQGDAYSGDYYLKSSNRTQSWHGPQILIDDICEDGVEYKVNTWIKTPSPTTVTLSMQVVDNSGQSTYSNIDSVATQGNWVELSSANFIMPTNASKVYLYFESENASVDIYIDDFVVSVAPVREIQQDIASLKDVFSSNFTVGAAATELEIATQVGKDLITKHYNSLTFANELKPDFVLDQSATLAYMNANGGDQTNPQVNIDKARTLLDFADENDIPLRGHVLVWHSQTPDWFFKENFSDSGDWVSQEVMLQRMENYIKNVMETLETEYPDVEFYAWDVANEIFQDDGTPRIAGSAKNDDPTYSAWVKIFGDNSFVDYAFEYARKYAPEGCKLYYNDYNEYVPAKTTAMIEMATRLQEKGIIDGIGMQSHLDISYPNFYSYENALKAFCETGLDVQITELDVATSDTSDAGLENQANYYKNIMDLIVKYSDSVSAVVFWGTVDSASWRADKKPLLFDGDFQAKPAYYAIIEDMETEITTTTTQATTTTTTQATTTTTTQATTTTQEPTTTQQTTTVVEPVAFYGDANLDGKVDISDVVAILDYITNLDKNALTQQGLINSDVHEMGNGVNSSDAAAISSYLNGTSDSLVY